MSIQKNRYNQQFVDITAGTVPAGYSDRYYGQDMSRDFRYLQGVAGRTLLSFFNKADTKTFLYGGVVTQYDYTHVNITAAGGIVLFDITATDDTADWSVPASVATKQIPVLVESTAQSALSISGGTLDGSTTNYIKLSFAETDIQTRSKLFASGTYANVIQDGYSITIDTTAPTNYELLLASFVGDGSSTLTITQNYPDIRTGGLSLLTLSALGTNWSTSLATALSSNATALLSSANAMQCTYVVSSNATLSAWASNTSGNDYTSVLVKSGSWSYDSGGVDLTTTGTKVVVGEVGSSLTFSDSSAGLYYSTLPTTDDYFIEDVNIIMTSTSQDLNGFVQVRNLRNCRFTYSGISTLSIIGFEGCKNVYNSYASITSTGGGTVYGFDTCTNVNMCSAIATSTSGTGYGFNACTGSECECSSYTTYPFHNSAILLQRYYSSTTTAATVYADIIKYVEYISGTKAATGCTGYYQLYHLDQIKNTGSSVIMYSDGSTILTFTSSNTNEISLPLLLSFIPNT